VFIPSPKELLSFIASGEHVGRIVCARSLITVDREDGIDVSWRWPPERQPPSYQLLGGAAKVVHLAHATFAAPPRRTDNDETG